MSEPARKAVEGYAPRMREAYPDCCWRLLEDGYCCIGDRGHDDGVHEEEPEQQDIVIGMTEEVKELQRRNAKLHGGPIPDFDEPAGSTAVWNPERIFPWLGDSEPCPSREEQAYERLLGAGGEIYEQLVAILNQTDDFNSNSMMHATDFWREVTGEQDLGGTAVAVPSSEKGEEA